MSVQHKILVCVVYHILFITHLIWLWSISNELNLKYPEKDSIQNVQDCNQATKQLAMTTLRQGLNRTLKFLVYEKIFQRKLVMNTYQRNILGTRTLSEILAEREVISEEILKILDKV